MCIEKLFFELLQVAIGTCQSLSFAPSANQWSELFALSKKQALAAVTFCGVRTLANTSVTHNLPEATYLKWLGLTSKIAQRNKALNAECDCICKEFAHDGLQSVVLKGQSNLVYYPENLRDCRTAGDIDL